MQKLFLKTKTYFESHKKFKEFILLLSIFLISLFIRRIGLKHGFPLLTHPDEPTIINPVLRMTSLKTLNPGNFNRPNQILYYLNFIYLNLVSFIAYGKNVNLAYEEHYLNIFYHSRLLISIMGSLIPVIAYKIGKEFKPVFGYAAALVFAVFPLYTLHSLYVTPDIPITLFTFLVIFFILRYLNTGSERYWVFATIFSAINTAEKYPGLISLGMVFAGIAIHIFSNNKTAKLEKFKTLFRYSIKIIITFLISLFIFAPFIFIEYQSVIEALIRESRTTHLGADNLGWFGNMLFYLKTFFSYSNFIGILFFGIGLFAIIRSRNIKYLVLMYGFLYWIILSKLALHWERWALPMYISPLFLIAIGVTAVWLNFKNNKFVRIVMIVVIGCFFFQQSVHTLSVPTRMKYVDTRLVARRYCEQNGITTSNSIYEGYTPLQPQHYKLLFDDYLIKDLNPEYAILSSYIYNRFYVEPERYAYEISVYDQLRNNNDLLQQIEPDRAPNTIIEQLNTIIYYTRKQLRLTNEERYTGPTIEIFRIIE